MKQDLDKIRISCMCGGKTKKIITEWKGIKCRAWKCKKCGEEILNPVDAQKVIEIVKARENKELLVKIRRVGKSITLTIPHKIVDMFNINLREKAEWEVPAIFENKFEIDLRD